MPELTRSVLFVWLFGLLAVSGLVFSVISHQPYDEHSVTIEGKPIEPESDDSVFSQDDMNSTQYRVANELLTETIVYEEFEREPFFLDSRTEIGFNGAMYPLEMYMPFFEHSVVEIDGSYYELEQSFEEYGKYEYFTPFDSIFALLSFFAVGSVISKTRGWLSD